MAPRVKNAPPPPATTAEIVHAIQTLAEFAFQSAHSRSLIDANSNVGEELALVIADIVKAQKYVRTAAKLREVDLDQDGKPVGFSISLANAILRILTLSYFKGVDIGSAVVSRAEYNKRKAPK